MTEQQRFRFKTLMDGRDCSQSTKTGEFMFTVEDIFGDNGLSKDIYNMAIDDVLKIFEDDHALRIYYHNENINKLKIE
jgi:hypothetical protein